MRDLNYINQDEFKKCGEIMVASKRNKLAMSCNFCRQLFYQLQAFMRHLQQQHNDKLQFVKKAKEVQVYAVEELINHSGSSCVLDAESDDSNSAEWLSKDDMKWLDDGIVPEKKRNKNIEQDDVEEDCLGISNMSILKAFEDFDVSLNLMDNKTSDARGDNKNNNLDYSILSEIEKDWEDSDTCESNDETITETTNITKHLMRTSYELEDVTKLPVNSTFAENATKEILAQVPCNGIKSLLQNLGDLEDLDSFLENLEDNSKPLNIRQISQDSLNSLEDNSDKTCQNFTLLQESKNFTSNEFESRLKEIEKFLENDHNDSIINSTKSSPNNLKHQKDFSSKLKELENSLNKNETTVFGSEPKCSPNITNFCKETASSDFEQELKSLEESMNNEVEDLGITKDKTNMPLNDGLKKVLADALSDEDYDLFKLMPEKENDEPLNQDILTLLEKEFTDTEINEQLPLPIQQKSLKPNNIINKAKNIAITKKQTNSLIFTTEIISKYQKTNLKSRTKTLESQNKEVIKPFKPVVDNTLNVKSFKKSNTTIAESFKNFNTTYAQGFKNSLEENHDIFLKHHLPTLNNSLKSSANISHSENFNERILKNKTPHKKYISPTLNTRKIKHEKLTPIISFINTERGDKTPVKREQIFLKQSPKTQEKEDRVILKISSKSGNKTPQETKVKLSPKTLEKQDFISPQQTPKVQHQKTPQHNKANVLEQSPKTQEKVISLQNDRTPEKISSLILNEQKAKNTISLIEKQTFSNQTLADGRPLTTPQKFKNVAIKLQRLSPASFKSNLTTQNREYIEHSTQSFKDDTNQFEKHIKLPKGLILSNKESSSARANSSKIIETPTKNLTYCKQNFSESCLEPLQNKTKEESPKNLVFSSIRVQSQIINKSNSEENISKMRQRMASIDIIQPSIETKPQTQMSSSKTPRNSTLNFKSYSVNRSARKREVLQRMRNIKKQIFKSIGERDECVTKTNRIKTPLANRQKRMVLIENVQVLPNINKDLMTPLLNPCENFKRPVVNGYTITPIANSVFQKNLADDQKQAKISLEVSAINSSINDDEKLIKKARKRPASSPSLNENKPAKRQHKSPVKEHNEFFKKTSVLDATQLDLSESVVDFLQRDLKANRLNVESLLNVDLAEDVSTPDQTISASNVEDTKNEEISKDDNLINEILEQVDKEKTINENTTTANDEKLLNREVCKDFDDKTDINLLSTFGLKIIKLPAIEDAIPLDERDKMNEKAIKLASIYKNWQRLWSTKNSETTTMKQELEKSFKEFLTEVNLAFKSNLNIFEAKRLANLINIWYTNNFSSKLIEKRRISNSINRILLMFHFMPKTIKRFYYCEYCEEYFNTEHKYYTHRIIHTGALFPYTCQKCLSGFKTVKHLRNHEIMCVAIENSEKYKVTLSPKSYPKSNIQANKCHVCAALFATSEQLYEHSKKHLKTIYKCAKCELVFATDVDVKMHMTICNTGTKNIPKQSTPRPPKPKARTCKI